MRDDSYLDEFDTVTLTARRPRWKAAAGAVASVVALALLVAWSYRLGVRDAHSVPVIRAVEGPAKIRPDDPGGARFDHQGRAVYDAVRGASVAPESAQALAPPPEPLAEEDLAPAEVAAAIAATAAAEAAAEEALLEAAPETGVAERIEQLVAEVVGAAPVELALVDPTPRAPVLSPVAPPRPGSAAAAAAELSSLSDDAPIVSAAVETGPAPGPAPGPILLTGPMIQLGAYLDETTALAMWAEIARRNGDLLAGRDPVLGGVRQDGRDLVLLRAGPFESGEQVRALCAQMRARNEDCLTVGAR